MTGKCSLSLAGESPAKSAAGTSATPPERLAVQTFFYVFYTNALSLRAILSISGAYATLSGATQQEIPIRTTAGMAVMKTIRWS